MKRKRSNLFALVVLVFTSLFLIATGSVANAGSISGQVTSGGLPVANVCVNAFDNVCGGNHMGGTHTDVNGNYSITGLPDGDFYVSTNNTDPPCDLLIYVDEWWDGADGSLDCNQAAPVAVTAGGDTPDINFALEVGGTISGRVTDLAGNPLANICVDAVAGNPCEWNYPVGARTHANGNYSIVVPEGTYYVQANPSCDSQNYVLEWWDGADGTIDCNQAAPVAVVVGQDTPNINFSLEEGGSVSGRVTTTGGQPIANVCVNAHDFACGGNWIGGSQTDASGNYIITGLPAGNVYIATHASCQIPQCYIDEWYDNTTDCNQAASVPVVVGQNTPGINFSLEQSGTISGRVTDLAGNPLANICIGAVVGNPCDRNPLGRARTDANGNYSIVVPGGTYYVGANPSCDSQNYVLEWWDGADGTIDCNQAAPLTVTAGQDTGNINFALEPGGSVSGTITDSQGNPISNIHVHAHAEPCDGNWLGRTKTDKDGNYTLAGLPGGNAYVTTCAHCSGLNYIDEWYDNVTDCNQAAPVPVVVGQDTPGINFELEQGGPVPDIKANGSDDPLFVTPSESVDISISLDPGDKAGEWADWWGILLSSYGTFPLFSFQCPLFELPETSIFSKPWPMGWYIFLFGLDDVPDGAFELDWYDYVVVVSQPAGARLENIPNFDDIVKEKMGELTGE